METSGRRKAIDAGTAKSSSKEIGDAFEKVVADTFLFMPNARVQRHVRIDGKDVDIVVDAPQAIGRPKIIAVEVKNYNRPMTRDAVSAELVSYHMLLQNRSVSQVLLVTRVGIVPGAKELFDRELRVHLTLDELRRAIAGPDSLIAEMKRQFDREYLSATYVATKIFDVDLAKLFKYYDLVFNEFVTYS